MLIKTDKTSRPRKYSKYWMVNIQQLLSTTRTIFVIFHQEQLQNKRPIFQRLKQKWQGRSLVMTSV